MLLEVCGREAVGIGGVSSPAAGPASSARIQESCWEGWPLGRKPENTGSQVTAVAMLSPVSCLLMRGVKGQRTRASCCTWKAGPRLERGSALRRLPPPVLHAPRPGLREVQGSQHRLKPGVQRAQACLLFSEAGPCVLRILGPWGSALRTAYRWPRAQASPTDYRSRSGEEPRPPQAAPLAVLLCQVG